MASVSRSLLVLALAALPASIVSAQGGARASDSVRARNDRLSRMLQGADVDNDPVLASAINEILSDTNAHMRMAPTRRATRADSSRAADIVRLAKAALSKYRDVATAERDGFLRFLPNVEPQSIYHYTNYEYAVAAMFTMDPLRPPSLLYRKDARGRLVLVGVMYTAPFDATTEELHARLPLGMAQWHEHVNFCGPQPRDVRNGTVRRDAATLARWLRITTESACDAAGGRFVPRLFGWMAHAYIFASDDPRVIWGGEGKGHMHMP